MPPKRASTGSAAGASKKPRTSNDNVVVNKPDEIHVPICKRWARVSVSGNLDKEYKLSGLKEPAQAYEYECICRGPYGIDGDDDDEDEEEWEDDIDEADAEGGKTQKPPPCDGGKTCVCLKPVAEHPDVAWKFTKSARRKITHVDVMCDVRDPESFGMYIYNDWPAYGAMEVLQNLILDFAENENNWKEQWVNCEVIAATMQMNGPLGRMTTSDDGPTVDETMRLVGRLFLSMLARLEREGLLVKDSEVKNLGLVMSMFIYMASDVRQMGLLDEREKTVPLGTAKFKYKYNGWEEYIVAYAKKYDIALKPSLSKIDDILENCKEVELPAAKTNTGAKPDPWAFKKTFAEYKKGRKVGGDSYDVTTLSSQRRKEAAFKKKDPFTKEQMDSIGQGEILQLA